MAALKTIGRSFIDGGVIASMHLLSVVSDAPKETLGDKGACSPPTAKLIQVRNLVNKKERPP
jgi:hypothetical protein